MFRRKVIPISIITVLLILSAGLYIFIPKKSFIIPSGLPPVSSFDKVAPVITLKGEETINLNLFDTYTEPGFAASDNIDGNLSKNISSANDIKTNRIGIYHVTYMVSDKAGNKTQKQRTINVLAPTINNTAGIPILMYHFFYDASIGQTGDGNFTEIASFDQQVKYLKDNKYYFPTWIEMNDYLDGKLNLPEKSVIITDDDGSGTFFSLAYPILVKYQVPATSFIITSWTNPSTMSIDRNLISFQSHSHAMHDSGCSEGHGGKFMCIDYQSGVDDLTTSKQITGASDVFCYPFGDYNDNAKQMLRDTGYKMAVTVEYGKAKIGMDKLELPRIRINSGISLDQFISSVQ